MEKVCEPILLTLLQVHHFVLAAQDRDHLTRGIGVCQCYVIIGIVDKLHARS